MAPKQIIYPLFFVAFFCSLLSFIPITAFAPFIVIAYYRYSFAGALWVAAGCGIIVDLLSSIPFGIYTINYICVTLILFRYCLYFFKTPIGLASLTAIFSLLSSLITKILFQVMGIFLPLTLMGSITDFLILPLIDGVYSLICFSLPLTLYRLARRKWFFFLFFIEEIKKKKKKKTNS